MGNGPKRDVLEPGTYVWCSCGKSKDAPFCDGSHVGSSNKPSLFNVKVKEERSYCTCGKSDSPPYCSGAHHS